MFCEGCPPSLISLIKHVWINPLPHLCAPLFLDTGGCFACGPGHPQDIGSLSSDFQVLMGVREQKVYDALVTDTTMPWRMAASFRFVECLDELTYLLFGDGDPTHKLTVHDLVNPKSSRVAVCQQKLLDMVRELAKPDSNHWALLDAIGVRRFQDPNLLHEINKYVRSQAMIYTSGIHKRLAVKVQSMPHILHYTHCEECSPHARERADKFAEIAKLPPCCLGSFGKQLLADFPTNAARASKLCVEVMRARKALQTFNTRRNELAHAFGKRILLDGRRANSLATFCQTEFLKQIYTQHLHSGGSKVEQVRLPLHQGDAAFPESGGDIKRLLPNYEPPPALALEDQPEGRLLALPARGKKRPGVGLNPKLFLYNKRMAAASSLAGDQKLTKERREEIRAECQADQAIPEFAAQNKAQWEAARIDKAFGEPRCPASEAIAQGGGGGVAYDPSPSWACGCESLPIHPVVFRGYVRAQNGLDNNEKAYDNGNFMTDDNRPEPLLSTTTAALSCMASLRNVCIHGTGWDSMSTFSFSATPLPHLQSRIPPCSNHRQIMLQLILG